MSLCLLHFTYVLAYLLYSYFLFVDNLVHLEYLLRCRRCYYAQRWRSFLTSFIFFPILVCNSAQKRDRHTKKKEKKLKNQDWLWRQHRPHTRFVKARNVTHLSLLYMLLHTFSTTFFYLCTREFSSRDDNNTKMHLFLLSTEFIYLFFWFFFFFLSLNENKCFY